MLFNSYVFVLVFLPLVLGVYCVIRGRLARSWIIAWLVLASLAYYAWWKPAFVALLLFSVIVNAAFGKLLCSGQLTRRASTAVLSAGILFNLALLGYFKYTNFFVQNVNDWFGLGWPLPRIILPIGISFITFQKIAFLIDAHRGLVKGFSLANYALFVTFFPQLIAGPIVHHAEMMPQFASASAPRPVAQDVAVGLGIFTVGLFKKVVIADSCAVYAEAGYATLAAGRPLDLASAWVTVLAYSFQLYYDFSGYSDMAIGLGRMFGFRLPVNFHSPYKATGMIDFWRRWHITLSRFLREYLYFPLGGSRRGPLRHYLNLIAVMLLGGLWHGANWTFVVWGAVHGMLLAVNHAWNHTRLSRLALLHTVPARAALICITFLAVTLAWIPFRAESLGGAARMLALLFPIGPSAAAGWESVQQFGRVQFADPRSVLNMMEWFKPRELWPAVLPAEFVATYRPAGLILAAVAVATFALPNTHQFFARFDPVLGMSADELIRKSSLSRLDRKAALILSAMFVVSLLHLSRVSPFLYFQF